MLSYKASVPKMYIGIDLQCVIGHFKEKMRRTENVSWALYYEAIEPSLDMSLLPS